MTRLGSLVGALVVLGAIGSSDRLWAQAPGPVAGAAPTVSAAGTPPDVSSAAPSLPAGSGSATAPTAAPAPTTSSAEPPVPGAAPPYGLPPSGPPPYESAPGAPGYGPPPPYPSAPPYYGDPPPPPMLDYREGDPIPPGYGRETKIRLGLVIAGAITMGVPWLLSAALAQPMQSIHDGLDDYDQHDVQFWPMFLPLAGPFVTIGTAAPDALGTFVLAADGVLQCGGLALLIVGLTAPRDVLVWEGPGESALSLGAAPLGRGAWGMALAGRY